MRAPVPLLLMFAALSSGCRKIDLRPAPLPHFYEADADLGRITLAPTRDNRNFVPVGDRAALRAHGCVECRDFHRIAITSTGVSDRWYREVEVLREPVIDEIEQALALELEACRRFRGGPESPELVLELSLDEFHVFTLVNEGEPADPVVGVALPMAAGMIPFPGAGPVGVLAAQKLGASVRFECSAAVVAVVRRAGAEVLRKDVRIELEQRGYAVDERRLFAVTLETLVQRLTHMAVADVCRELDALAAPGRVVAPEVRTP